MEKAKNIYGWVNGEAVYSNEEFRYKSRGFGAITNDDDLMAYAEKVTYGWSDAGHKRTFIGFYLSDYAMSEPYRSLTHAEFDRLKELQAEARRKAKEADDNTISVAELMEMLVEFIDDCKEEYGLK